MASTSAAYDRSLSIYALSARSMRQDARTLFSRLSAAAPVHWDPYAGTWLVAGRAEALRACTGPEFSALRLSGTARHTAPGAPGDARRRVADVLARQALFLDGPAHAAWARIIRRALAPGRVDALTPWIVRRVADLVRSGAAGGGATTGATTGGGTTSGGTPTSAAPSGGGDAPRGSGRLDVVADLAAPLPLDVIARLFALPPADTGAIRTWSEAYTRVVTGVAPEADAGVFALVAEFTDYALDLVRHRRASPGPDALTTLIAGADATAEPRTGTGTGPGPGPGPGMGIDFDIAANLLMLIAAGHQTTTGFLSGAVLERLRPTWGPLPPGTPGDAEVEELLARVSPSRFVGRLVTRDTELGGHRLRAGQSVLVLLAAANWHALDHRANGGAAPAGHLAFGHGRHRCPGARLARLESRLVLEHLFGPGRRPTLTDASVPWSDNVNLPCPLRVPIALSGHAEKGSPV
ncbi:cytochrome P450 [Streptomyces flavofungini]|uniref:cytochrome P450 n=1 Tax=Streptomyces flavofungini TaxID=68200 RepID=UPI0025AFFD2A|nr:cytochrome P450 [Streptomyces flavofungini]WJV45638.1 cytochrome P450 [Streptomyces flavofungini]